jgi:hypothetical protein
VVVTLSLSLSLLWLLVLAVVASHLASSGGHLSLGADWLCFVQAVVSVGTLYNLVQLVCGSAFGGSTSFNVTSLLLEEVDTGGWCAIY